MNIYGNKDRVNNAKIVMGSGDFNYELDVNWAKWPDHLLGCVVVCACTDPEGNLYATTRGTGEPPVVVFAPDGRYIRSIGEGLFSDNLHGIFYTSRSSLLCTDGDRHVVREIDLDGKLIRDFGNLDKPSDSGYEMDVFTWLKKQNKIGDNLKFDAQFGFQERFETITHAAPPFNKPTRMVEGSDGNFYASDGYGNAAVHKFDKDGSLIKTWGGSGRGKGEFRLPHGLWIDIKDRIHVADRENNRVHVYSTDGELLHMIEDLIYRPAEIWSNDDNIFIAEVDGGMTILDMDLNIVSQFGYYQSPLLAHGMTGDLNDNLFIQTIFFNKKNNLFRMVRV